MEFKHAYAVLQHGRNKNRHVETAHGGGSKPKQPAHGIGKTGTAARICLTAEPPRCREYRSMAAAVQFAAAAPDRI